MEFTEDSKAIQSIKINGTCQDCLQNFLMTRKAPNNEKNYISILRQKSMDIGYVLFGRRTRESNCVLNIVA